VNMSDFGVKGIFAGFVSRSGNRRVGMASARAEQDFGCFGLGWGHREG
jgi:hypothetical protein